MNMRIKKNYYLYSVLGALIGLAVFSFIYQVVKGLSVTGLREPVVWGIYVVNFTFFFGLGAGILMWLAFASIKKAISDEFMFLSSLAAFITLGLAGAFIIIDLGRPDRFFYILIHAQLESPLVWDFIVMNIFMLVSFLFCFASLREIYLKRELREGASSLERLVYNTVTAKREFSVKETLLKKSRLFILFLVVGCYLITTEVFAGMRAHPQWHTLFLSLIFLSSAVLCGLSVMMLLEGFLLDKGTFFRSKSKFLLSLLSADLLIILIKYGMDRINPLIEEVHSLFPFSFLIFLILGNIIPLLLMLFYQHKGIVLYRWVPIFILAGVLLKRAEAIIPVYYRRWLPFPPEASYLATFPEMSVVLGTYCAGIAAFIGAFYLTKVVIAKKQSAV